VVVLQRQKRLAVECREHFDLLVGDQRLNADFTRSGDHNGTVRECVRGDRRDGESVDLRVEDRTAGREIVRGGAGRAGDDEPIGFDAHHELAVDRNRQLDDARERSLSDDHVVEDDPIRESASGRVDRDVQHHPLLGQRSAVYGILQRRKQFGQRYLREKPEAPEIHPEDRHVHVCLRDTPRGPQESAVAPEHHDEIDGSWQLVLVDDGISRRSAH
jgi:hypothetical protein